MDDQRLLEAHRGEGLGDPAQHLRVGDSEQLDRRTRRIDARAEQIHDRAHFQLPPNQRGMLHARVIGRGEEEAEAGLVEQRPGLCRARCRSSRPTASSTSAEPQRELTLRLPCLAIGRPAGDGDEGGGSRHVDQSRTVAAGAATIGIEIVGPVERQSGGAERLRRADHFLGGLALHSQSDQHSGDFGGLELAEHQPLEEMLGILDRQVFARQQLGQRVGDRPGWVMPAGCGTRESAATSRGKVRIWLIMVT